MSTFTTPGGKEITTFLDPKTAQLRIKFVDGGELPQELTGIFTSRALADIAIRSYLLRNEDSQVKATVKKEEKKEFIKEMKETLSTNKED